MDAHECEYLGAVAGMNDASGCYPLPLEGAEVTGSAGGRRFRGIVQSAEPGRVVVEISGAWISVGPECIDPPKYDGIPLDVLILDPSNIE